jgi:predicted DNA-binding transcriptional regulator AlpA
MPNNNDPSRTAANWPPYLTARRVIAYTGFTRSSINRAVASGALPVYGRPGGERGERVFRREDVDRWLSGNMPAATAPARAGAPSAPTPRPTSPRMASTTATAEALARIKRTAKGL